VQNECFIIHVLWQDVNDFQGLTLAVALAALAIDVAAKTLNLSLVYENFRQKCSMSAKLVRLNQMSSESASDPVKDSI